MKKKVLIMTLFALITASVRSQIIAGFDCHSPNAWFDKEIFFVAHNNVSYYDPWYGYVPNTFYNVYALVDGVWYGLNGPWNYNTAIFIDNVKLDQGSRVDLYSNGQFLGAWVCNEKQPTFKDVALRAYKNKPHTKPNSKSIQKLVRVLEKDLPKILRRIK